MSGSENIRYGTRALPSAGHLISISCCIIDPRSGNPRHPAGQSRVCRGRAGYCRKMTPSSARADPSLHVEPLLRNGLPGHDIEAAVIDRLPARGWALILYKQHDAARLGRKLLLVMRIGVVDHRAGLIDLSAYRERAFEDIPDLCEIVPVHGMVRAGLVAYKPGIGLGRSLRPGMEQHLAPLAGEAQRFPLAFAVMQRFHRVVAVLALNGCHLLRHRYSSSLFSIRCAAR